MIKQPEFTIKAQDVSGVPHAPDVTFRLSSCRTRIEAVDLPCGFDLQIADLTVDTTPQSPCFQSRVLLSKTHFGGGQPTSFEVMADLVLTHRSGEDNPRASR